MKGSLGLPGSLRPLAAPLGLLLAPPESGIPASWAGSLFAGAPSRARCHAAPPAVCVVGELGKPPFGTCVSRQWLGQRAAVRGGGTGRGCRGRESWEGAHPWMGTAPGVGLRDRSRFWDRTGWKAFTRLSYRTEGPSLSSSDRFFFFFNFLVSREELEAKWTVVVFCITYSKTIQLLLYKVFDT